MLPRYFRTSVLALCLSFGCVAGDSDAITPTPEGDAETPQAGASTAVPSEPSATPAISLTPPPNAPPADLATANRLQAEGELQQALQAYLSISASTAPNRAEGVYGAARVLLEMERPAEARTLLEPFVAAAPPAEAAPARYLLARAYTALSMFNEALQQYDAYIQTGRVAVPYAQLDRARILIDAGQPLAAATGAQAGLNAGLPSGTRRTFTMATAQAYEKAGAFADALRWFQTLYDQSPGDQPMALQRMAAIKQQQGNADYVNDLVRLMGGFPTTQAALQTLKDFEAEGRAVDAYIRGLVYYRHNDYDRAEPPLRERINAAPEAASSAEAYYFLAAIVESRGDNAQAMAFYSKVVALNPSSSLADDALWWRGRILEDEGKRAEAQALYNTLLTGYPSSSFANDAAFRRGMLSYKAGNQREAANIWGEGAAAASGTQRQRLAFWQGKALLKAGDRTAAEPALQSLASSGEDDYYGVRSVAALKGDHDQPKAERDTGANLTPAFDWAAAEAWLTAKTGRAVAPAAAQAWSTDARWLRAQELWLVGRTGQANTEAFDLIEAYAQDAIAMYSMARVLWDRGQFSLSAMAGQRVLRVVNTNPNAGIPKALLSLSYPAPYAASLQKYASAERISPLLKLAFIRQESFFDPSAQSPANAYGLTQLLPGTANTVAGRLGLGSVAIPDLYKADLNLRLGASYMGAQLRDFNDYIFVAFAAYNAGPNAARGWLPPAGTDADLYVETVAYAQTRDYIEIVAENYAMYRYIYGGSAVPDLPPD